jgi:phosphinothricin acetyltransferase
MQLIECTFAEHGAQLLEILNEEIRNATSLYEYHPRSLESIKLWFDAKQRDGYPVFGIVSGTELRGFGSYGPFRHFPAFKYTLEHSVYVHQGARRQGVGRKLLHRLVERAVEQEYHVMIGAIDVDNQASIALHQSLGFQHLATLPEVGFKFGRWLNLALFQRVLATPLRPVDGPRGA